MGKRRFRQIVSDSAGGAAIVLALTMPLVVGGFGLGAEVGLWYFNQRKLQNAADVAAYAAATEVRAGRTEWAAEAADAAARRTGYDADRGTIEVVTPYNSRANEVEVRVRENLPRLFSGIFANGAVPLGGRAVARIDTEGPPTCVLALDTSGEGALTFSGNTSTTIKGCNVHANSLDDNSVIVEGNPRVVTDCVSTAGGVREGRPGLLDLECGAPLERVATVYDPYLGKLSPPTAVMAEDCQPQTSFNGTHTIASGRYCGVLELKGDITLQPGVYVVDGVHINAQAKVFGEGVTIYIAGSGEFRANGGADIKLSAPTSGDYAGVLIYADAPSGVSPLPEHKINGTATSFYDGAIYAPWGNVEVLGNSTDQGGCMQVIAHRIKFSGNSGVGIDCSGTTTADIQSARRIRLVE